MINTHDNAKLKLCNIVIVYQHNRKYSVNRLNRLSQC